MLVAASSTAAFAQKREPIPPFVVDARVAIPLLKEDPVTAADLGINTAQLANRGLGITGGANFYPLRRGGFALGLGGELLFAGASHQDTDLNGQPIGTKINRRFQNASFQMSLNFGKRNGWSYLTFGMGPVAFDTYFEGTEPDGLRQKTLNYGGGARWFNYEHVAFSLDLRIYATVPANPTLIVGGRQRTNVLVLSAGVSIK
jgi:hypothetical protein